MISPSLASMMGRKVLLLSPHADDAAYSVGGIVAHLSRQADIQLMTIFGRSGWALPQAPCERSVDAISKMREEEDRAYCRRRRIDYTLLACPDSFVMGYDEAKEMNVAAAGDLRTANIVRLIRDVMLYLAPHVVLAPIGLGGHIDHQIVRTAADALDQDQVLYYEDIPYCAGLPLAEMESQLVAQGLAIAVTVDIENVLAEKCEDMWGYRSQTSTSTIAEMLQHASRIGTSRARYAERLWHRAN